MWLKEYGMVANTILHAPMSFKGETGSLERAGFDPVKFISLPRLGTHLSAQGVKPYAFQHNSITHSGLSRMFLQDVETAPFQTPADLWVSLRQLLEHKPTERMYAYVYWGQFDGLSHRHGPDDERSAAEFAHFSMAFEQFFLKRLPPAARKNTLLLLTADHGQIHTPHRPNNETRLHPNLLRHLHILPTGEHRLAYLYPRCGEEAALRAYFEETWPEQFSLISSGLAIEAGLFGPPPHHPGLRDRVGDLIAISRGDTYLWWDTKENFLVGRHGGLHPQEMLVPLLGVRLG
jgi:hypothetical protein